ncbi:hypothetical protein SAMN05661091_3163 [Paenibacillus uliginis N3/975]|uniref:Uncharacterized protein n=1 Tax=Paenibacillus uliginis N3/975 TaxID=1313296 RepID=A0A1X7HFM1_9BACL|nr:hypothetical protein [Paenibacillus uliginis]SMF85809.1 hypothetical protein SAMN05661091_3163 [Paenibacillus uliginis N3/975]
MIEKEQHSVVIKVKNTDELVRGISRKMNQSYLFIETEESPILRLAIADIIEIFAIQSPPQNRTVLQWKNVETKLGLIIAQFKNLNDNDQEQIISELSKYFGKPLIISRNELGPVFKPKPTKPCQKSSKRTG